LKEIGFTPGEEGFPFSLDLATIPVFSSSTYTEDPEGHKKNSLRIPQQKYNIECNPVHSTRKIKKDFKELKNCKNICFC
jgi:hypothetical protein